MILTSLTRMTVAFTVGLVMLITMLICQLINYGTGLFTDVYIMPLLYNDDLDIGDKDDSGFFGWSDAQIGITFQ